MHSGLTVDEIYQVYTQNSRERNELQGRATAPRHLHGTMFEYRDLQHVVEGVQIERVTLNSHLAHYRRAVNRSRQNTANEASQVVPAVLRP